ncbi:hypothetical protein [Herbaspirillum robiniae]|uniref:hypothetical protein n=1 Tax=Herbaspirillum robiniae TaxID=2014887 RepID=UPI00101ADA61|nr:hypothetical protein [Herbaspirillum robiniae]
MKKIPLCQSEQVVQYSEQRREKRQRSGAAGSNEDLARACRAAARHRDRAAGRVGKGLIRADGKLKSKKAVSAGLRPKPETAFNKRFPV